MRFAPLLACLVAAPAAAQDNVLLILSDDMGVDMVGCYREGPDPAPTPAIDRLAESGVLFRNVWTSPACSPARAQIQTGRHGFRTGIGMVVSKNGWALDPAELTLPEAFDQAGTGHAHGFFGKWHLGNDSVGGDLAPNLAGYAHFAGTAGNLTKPQTFYDYELVENGVAGQEKTYATTATVDAFLEWQRQVGEPWFAVVAFHAPHEPWHRPPHHLHSQELPAGDPRENARVFYKAMIEAMDTEIARLLGSLEPEVLRDTNVVFLADNGTPQAVALSPFEPDHAKLTPYEGGSNVPMIVSGPAVERPGREVRALVAGSDLFATLLELGGVQVRQLSLPHEIDSTSVVPYLSNPTQLPLRQFAYTDLFQPNGHIPRSQDVRMIRDYRYKLIRKRTGNHDYELYDLAFDSFETTNLWGSRMTADQYRAFVTLNERLEALTQGE